MSDTTLKCPQCSSEKLYRDGLRYLADGSNVQRWLCRNCGYRFTKKSCNSSGAFQPLSRIQTQSLKTNFAILSKRQVCDCLTEASKNLTEVARQETAQREGTTTNQHEAKDKILQYAWWLKKKGRSEATIKSRVRRLKGLAKHCNLMDPEAVKETLAKLSQKNSTKAITTSVYTNFLKCFGLTWEPPEYKMEESIPFIPLETEIDQLIASCNKRTAALLQLLKETGARIGEAARLQWIDLDSERRTLRIQAEKGSNPRMLGISEKLVGMLNALPKRSEYIFNPNTKALRTSFVYQRARATVKLNNPRLKRITFHTLRHWKGTMEYHKTKDPWHVKRILGHKTLSSTEVYINVEQAIFQISNDEYHVKVAHDLKEACQLLETGFEYVTDMEGIKLFRKRK
ncbi:MAG: tyrosine-type recombinase/integrase [Candidatus Bathyarchaeota archaeon]|nr:tyrosine-type recombinase/integrase [Candidatus Bathyarchaeota archaeon]